MPETGYYEKRPRPEHRRWLIQKLLTTPTVSDVDAVDDFRLIVRRDSMSTIYVYLTNAYELGVADVIEIMGAASETTCIVSTMSYNQYSGEAKETARERGVGLFRGVEFLGAIYYDGPSFLDYVPPRRR
jgi:hypothetical protein